MKLIERPVLGKCLKRIRQDRGWSMMKMGDTIGIAQSTLSKVENSQLSLSYDKLITISQRLDLDIEELFSTGNEQKSSSGARMIVDRANDRSLNKSHGLQYRSLAMELKNRLMVVYYVEQGESDNAINLPEGGFNAERMVYVLEGQLEFYSEHYEMVVLNPGDSLYYDMGMKFGHSAVKGQYVKAISVTTSLDKSYLEIARAVASEGFAYVEEWEDSQHSADLK